MRLGSIAERLYADFLMPSRLAAYEALLDHALRGGYRITSIERFRDVVIVGGREPSDRYLILRHDVDTDPRTAAAMWAIERRHGIDSSWFFRLSTVDLDLIRSIAESGGQASYHFEELAAMAKRRRLRTAADVMAHLPEARADFRANLARLRAATGLPMRVVASHGDFVNRAVGIANRAILDDPAFRAEVGIDLEAYDDAVLGRATSRHSDTHHPRYWVAEDPLAAIDRGEPVVHVLVHPRHWYARRGTNVADDVRRIWEGIAYRLPIIALRRMAPRRSGQSTVDGPSSNPRPAQDGTPDSASGLRVAMALYADITFDSRVQREAEALALAGHRVTVFCLGGAAPIGASFRVVAERPSASDIRPDGSSPFLRGSSGGQLGRIASRIRWMVGYLRNLRAWGRWAVAAAADVDVWHAHDLTGLIAVGPLVRSPAVLVYDSHEIFLETGTAARLPASLRRVLSAYERRLAGRAAALVTVNDQYGAVLTRRLAPHRVVIVRNCAPRWTPPKRARSLLRNAAGAPPSAPIVLYHGSFTINRGIEQLAEAMLEPGVESAHLVLLGFGGARGELVELAARDRFGGRIHVLDAVAPSELLDWVAGADVDVIPLQRSSLNHWLCTPNKLWESLAAGVPVVVSDFPAMRPIVLDDPLGPLGSVCAPADPASIGTAVAAILAAPPARRTALRRRCLAAAHERWSWEREAATLVELYRTLGSRSGPPPGSPVP